MDTTILNTSDLPQLLYRSIRTISFPLPLTAEEEQDALQRMAKGDVEARADLIEHNLRLVAHIVKKFDIRREQTEDLISIGTIGLIKGIEKLDKIESFRIESRKLYKI